MITVLRLVRGIPFKNLKSARILRFTFIPHAQVSHRALVKNVPKLTGFDIRYVHDTSKCNANPKEQEVKKVSLYQRFKQMYRDYWYVLIPVHLLTSSIWFASFYYAAKSGVDIVALVEALHLPDTITEKLKNHGQSTAGYLAIAYALYKIFTPLRYMVTVGGTTYSIKFLTKRGYIQPIPKKEELKKMIQDKKDSMSSIMSKVKQKKP